MTGVSLAEASVYARWRGKRLLTLLEWEYAVRGEKYRAASDESDPMAVLGLCSSPLEWTATPRKLVSDAFDFAEQCRSHLELLLAPPEDPNRLDTGQWVAGPSWHERLQRPSGPDRRYDDLGFRCALAAQQVYERLDRGLYQPVE